LQADEDAGAFIPDVARKYRINPLAKIIVGAGDVLALISSAPPAFGRVTCSIGSSSMVFVPIDAEKQISDPLNRVYTYPLLNYPLIGGVSSTTGAALKWACENLYPELSFDEAINKALSVPEGCGGLLFLPFLSGERNPYWNDKLKGGFYGLTLLSTRPMMLRAVMEGVGYSLKYLIDIFNSLGVTVNEIAIAGGGATAKGWPRILANICQKPVCIYTGEETVTHALFAYACKALNDGRTFDQAILQSFDKFNRIYPDPKMNKTYQVIYERYCKIADFMHKNIG
jgi:sugar (pentulose or hexulose) kinase